MVLSGKTYYNTDPKKKRTGSMANQGAVSVKLNAGEGYTIPSGFHNGGGKVEANGLASQTPGNATAAHILSGQSAWVNGNKVNGGIPWQNADADGDQAWSTKWANWGDGNIFMGVRNGYYMNGVNWIRTYVQNFTAENIKKGVNVGGIIGTFEGFVPSATDLYYRGNNSAGFITNSGAVFEAGQIKLSNSSGNSIRADINFVGRNYLNIQGHSDFTTSKPSEIRISKAGSSQVTFSGGPFYYQDYVASIPLATFQLSGTMTISFSNLSGVIYRIWFS